MKHSYLLAIAAAFITVACQKDDDEPAPPTPPATTCGMDGARLQGAFDGTTFCANASLFAADGGGVMTISGMTQQGATLTLEIEDLFVGTHPLNDTQNTVLFTTNMAIAYNSTDGDPGTLTITTYDTVTRRIKGSFSASLTNPLGGPSKPITGSFDMFYVD